MKIKILLAVTGSIAAYKMPSLVSILVEKEYDVKVMMSKAAEKFVTPLSLATMSKNKVYTEDIAFANDGHVHHIELAQWANIVVVVPATFNTMTKMQNKTADNLITSTIVALPKPHRKILIFPAMNMHMWENLNIEFSGLNALWKENSIIYKPASGKQACGDVGLGKLLPIKDIVKYIEKHI